jgi:small-conductance mechanosensitive channel
MIRLLATLLLALYLGPGVAAEGAAAAPDPRQLSADWWAYFEPLGAARLLLQRYSRQPELALNAQQSALVGKILGALDRFEHYKSAEPPLGKPLPTVATGYTLESALQRHASWRALGREVDAESEESQWQSTILAEERKQQSRRRANYLMLDDSDPDRLQNGLELMLSRVGIELQRLELERRRSVLRLAEQRLAALQAELDAIPDRLVLSPGDATHWREQYETAQAANARLREDADQTGSAGTRLTDVGHELGEAQRAVAVAVRRDIEISVNELLAMQARLAQSLVRFLQGAGSDATEAARTRLVEYQALSESIQQQRTRWRRIAARSHSLVAAPVADNDTAAGATPLRQRIMSTLEGVDRALLRLDQQAPATEFVAELLRFRQQAGESWWRRSLADLRELGGNSWTSGVEVLGATLFEINETPVTTLGLLRVVMVLTLALWLSKGLRRTIARVGERRGGVSQSSLYTVGRLAHYLVLGIGIIIGLSSIGIDFTKFALFASALGVGIGFGLQTLIGNFVAGLIILFEKSLKVGDFVELESGVTGEVKEINMRSTLITTNDNIDILVPNSEFVGGRVTSWTLREVQRRVHIPFGVAYGSDKERVRKAVLEAADNVPWTLHKVKGRQPQVWLVNFGDSSLDFELVAWLTPEAVKRPGAVQAAYLWEIETRLREYGIEIPFPQRDLHLRSGFGRPDAASASLPSGDPPPD